jgi:hypothetical protein
MIQGDRLVQIYHRDSLYQVKLPSPPTLTNALNHLSKLEPHVRENLVVVWLVAETVVSAEDALAEADREARDRMDTTPAPPLRPDSDPYLQAVSEGK